MKTADTAIASFLQRGKPFSISEAREAGTSPAMLSYYCKTGKIQRLGRGVYTSADSIDGMYPEIAWLQKRNTDFVVCLLSALRIHDFTTQLPIELWIAIPFGARVPQSGCYNLRCVHLSGTAYDSDIEEHIVDEMKVRVYSAAKTVADCFKFRNKIGLDVALEALYDGWRKRLFTIDKLTEAAVACRVFNVMRPYMEGLLSP